MYQGKNVLCDSPSQSLSGPKDTTASLLMELQDAIYCNEKCIRNIGQSVCAPRPENAPMCEQKQAIPNTVNDFLYALIGSVRRNNDQIHDLCSRIESVLGEAKIL